jgi:hypothetical protein
MTPSNKNTYSLLEYDKAKKMTNLNAGHIKIRGKYEVDIVRYESEKMNVV